MKKKIGPKKIDLGNGQKAKREVNPIEDFLHLQGVIRFEMRKRRIGAFLLQKSKTKPYSFVFGFRCHGIHSFLSLEEIYPIFTQLEQGIKKMPAGETLTIHLSAFRQERDRQAQLEALIEKAPTEEIKFMLTGERARVQELTGRGLREPKAMYLYVTYTLKEGGEVVKDWVDSSLLKVEKAIDWFQGKDAQKQEQQWHRNFRQAFTNGFNFWEELLSTTLKLSVEPLNEQELWEQLWRRFNWSSPIKIPQEIIVRDNEIQEEIRSEVDATTLLIHDALPKMDRSWVHLKNKYVGGLTFWQKPGGWADELDQMHYLWEAISRDDLSDTEVFCQITPANRFLVRTAMQRLAKQSQNQATKSKSQDSFDAAAEINTRESINAQMDMYKGKIPFHVGVVILVHRRDKKALEEAQRKIESYFSDPAWVLKETDMMGKLWLQTLPIVQEKLLATNLGDRRLCYLNSEVLGLMPLVMTRPISKQGVELIAEDGGTPLYIDLCDYDDPFNIGLFATTRAGKSVFVSDILKHSLANLMPIVALDFPQPNGASTFKDFTKFMGDNGAYFDISSESSNLFEKPDLRAFPQDLQQERFNDYRHFLEGALLAMCIGKNQKIDPILEQTIQSLLGLALNTYFNNSQISERYHRAQEDGFGSIAWSKSPTLDDYIEFCRPERLDLSSVAGNINDAFQQIQLRLRYWKCSRVGRAISRPSTFPTDAMLLVFALANLSNEEEAALLALSAYSAALRRALGSIASIFFIDEAPILFEFEEIAALVSRLCANGGKAGIRTIISAQDPDTVAKSKHASKIFQNLRLRLIGRIQSAAVDSFCRILKYPPELIRRNVYYRTNKKECYTPWLCDNSGNFTECRYYPAYVQLGITANNRAEQEVRALYLEHYADKFEAVARFSIDLATCFSQGRPVRELAQQFQTQKVG